MATKSTATDTRRAIRRAREIAGTRQYIVEAAMRAFARLGYGAATVDDIAREAGYTTPSLYSYFRGKEEIVAEMVRQFQVELLATVDYSPPAGLPFEEQLRQLVRRQLEYADRRREALLLFLTMGADAARGPSDRAQQLKGFDAYVQRLITWFAAATKPLPSLHHSPEILARTLLGISNGFFMRWVMSGAKEKIAYENERIVDLFLHGILGAPPLPKKPKKSPPRR